MNHYTHWVGPLPPKSKTLEPTPSQQATLRGGFRVLGGFAGREVGDIWEFDVATETWSCLSETLKPPRSVACCEGVGSRVLLFGGELQPSDRGHEGAGAFSSDTQIFEASTSMKVAGDGKGK